MITPYIPDQLFDINESPSVSFTDGVIYIDNIFKNFDDILKFVNNANVERWKASPTSRNFKDYYDCRAMLLNTCPCDELQYKKFNFYYQNISKYFKLQSNLIFESNYSFNYFKHKNKNIPSNFQHYPHYDHSFNILHFIDEECNGGTAIYENVDRWVNNEHDNLLYDISNLKIKQIVKAKPNRCVIFDGRQLHGGYIADNNAYYDKWRINLVNFIKEDN